MTMKKLAIRCGAVLAALALAVPAVACEGMKNTVASTKDTATKATVASKAPVQKAETAAKTARRSRRRPPPTDGRGPLPASSRGPSPRADEGEGAGKQMAGRGGDQSASRPEAQGAGAGEAAPRRRTSQRSANATRSVIRATVRDDAALRSEGRGGGSVAACVPAVPAA